MAIHKPSGGFAKRLRPCVRRRSSTRVVQLSLKLYRGTGKTYIMHFLGALR